MAIIANRKSSVCVENMATAGRFAASSEEEIAKILSEKDAENTNLLRNPQSNVCTIYGSQAVSLVVHCQFQGVVIYGYHFLFVVNFKVLSYMGITFCPLSMLVSVVIYVSLFFYCQF